MERAARAPHGRQLQAPGKELELVQLVGVEVLVVDDVAVARHLGVGHHLSSGGHLIAARHRLRHEPRRHLVVGGHHDDFVFHSKTIRLIFIFIFKLETQFFFFFTAFKSGKSRGTS